MNKMQLDIMKDMISILNEASGAYYNTGTPIMTDEQFDTRLEDLRQLEEETGYNAKNWESLGYIWTSPGFCNEKLYLFKASNLTYKGQHLDEGELLNHIEIEKEKIFEMIKTGKINDAKSISALMRAYKL